MQEQGWNQRNAELEKRYGYDQAKFDLENPEEVEIMDLEGEEISIAAVEDIPIAADVSAFDALPPEEKMAMGKKAYKATLQSYIDECGAASITAEIQAACRVLTPEKLASIVRDDPGPAGYYARSQGYTNEQIVTEIGDMWMTNTKRLVVAGTIGLVTAGVVCAVECPRLTASETESPSSNGEVPFPG